MERKSRSTAMIALADKMLSITTSQIMAVIGVSFAEYDAWEKGVRIPYKYEQRIRKMLKIDDLEPELVLWVGSVDDAKKWENVVASVAERAYADYLAQADDCDAEDATDSEDDADADADAEFHPLLGGKHLLALQTFDVLRKIGVKIPQNFPKELEKFMEPLTESALNSMSEFPLVDFIYRLYLELADIYNFYLGYVEGLVNDEDVDMASEDVEEMEASLIELAACHVYVDTKFAPKLDTYKPTILQKYASWLSTLKTAAEATGIEFDEDINCLLGEDGEMYMEQYAMDETMENAHTADMGCHTDEIMEILRDIRQTLKAIANKL